MDVGVSNRVAVRSSMGQFIAACREGARDTVTELLEEGAQESRDMAPTGSKHDPRTVPLAESIVIERLSATQGRWVATARHALPQEFGAVAHPIVGSPHLRFFWEKEGRMFVSAADFYGDPEAVTIVNHPGHGPQPYLRPAYEKIMAKAMQIARRNYPG
jgi:hypothetical protein